MSEEPEAPSATSRLYFRRSLTHKLMGSAQVLIMVVYATISAFCYFRIPHSFGTTLMVALLALTVLLNVVLAVASWTPSEWVDVGPAGVVYRRSLLFRRNVPLRSVREVGLVGDRIVITTDNGVVRMGEETRPEDRESLAGQLREAVEHARGQALELEAAPPPEGSGTELEAAVRPAGRGTELEAATPQSQEARRAA